jgi:2-polyprenyl-3-methyl-5-hydroxy-6-metoxy-1,4-benzoquinol methylase
MLTRLKNLVMGRSRARKIDHFFSLFKQGMTVLDVGVHGGEGSENLTATNQFLNHFPYADADYVGLGIDDLSAVAKANPGKTFIQYAGDEFPFKDNAFDFVFSNAVIEHVGDDDAQLHFLNEMVRVGKQVFFTTPNKYFPVEPHTNSLLMHWINPVFYAWCRRFSPYWTPDNLRLISYRRISELMRQCDASTWQIHRNRLLGLTMTFTVVCSR